MNRRHLSIYLNDHLAGATAGRDLVRRAAGSNRGSDYGSFLARLAEEVQEDRETLLRLMSDLGVRVDQAKVAAGWTAEKLGRLKLNGQLLGYSPQSRVVELEAMTLGVRGKHGLWLALRSLRDVDPVLAKAGLPGLIARAERQLAGLEEHRLRAVREALAD